MSRRAQVWLVAYDIRDRRRLARVHRLLRRQGLATQCSLFALHADDAAIDRLFAQLATLIDPGRDDVRAYPVPTDARIWRFGRQTLPEGVMLAGGDGLGLLLGALDGQEREA